MEPMLPQKDKKEEPDSFPGCRAGVSFPVGGRVISATACGLNSVALLKAVLLGVAGVGPLLIVRVLNL
jgi:hypothetical protein